MEQNLVQLMSKCNEGFAIVNGTNIIHFGDYDLPTEVESQGEFYGSSSKSMSRQEFLENTTFR